ncbi:plasmid recombination protein [Acinetobacter sp. B5B]|uniref:MobV family relaxase n=1 Tax=Acinetobacter baretiae TaxID=2605383 RepID=UPI0018C2248D|nr:MobV family relaxase [Acinetobacter baretiae]MBF7684067.1 plasmid recombination protein [Acinetobacter baretiae]
MSFLIFRTKKLKSFGEISGSLSHNYRTRSTPNANPKATPQNEHSHLSENEVLRGINDRIPKKVRKNGVLCIETLMTASPEWGGWSDPKKETELFEKSKTWLIEKFGADNVIATSIHRDETTPHLVAYIVPLDPVTNKLNARHWLGGRTKLSQLQTDYHQAVTQHDQDFGLRRGIIGSKAKHTTIQKFYSQIQEPTPLNQAFDIQPTSRNTPLPKKPFFESQIDYLERIKSVIYEDVESQVDAIKEQYEQFIQDMQQAYENQLKAIRIQTDQEKLAHHRAIKVIQDEQLKVEALKKEFQLFSQYKKFFPHEHAELEKRVKIKLLQHQKASEEGSYTPRNNTSYENRQNDHLEEHLNVLKHKEEQRIELMKQSFEQDIEHAPTLAEQQVYQQNYQNWKSHRSSNAKQQFVNLSSNINEKTPLYGLVKQLIVNDAHEAFLDLQIEVLQNFRPKQIFEQAHYHVPICIQLCAIAEQYLYQRQLKLHPQHITLNQKIETLRDCFIKTEDLLRQESFSQEVKYKERDIKNEVIAQEFPSVQDNKPKPKIVRDPNHDVPEIE